MQGEHFLTDRLRAHKDGLPMAGLVFRVAAEKLRSHCVARAGHHEKRAADKAAEIPKLTEAIASLQESIDSIKGIRRSEDKTATAAVHVNKMSRSSDYEFDGSREVTSLEHQVEALQNDIKDHRAKATSFMFMSESFFQGEYALGYEELRVMELVK